MSALKRLKGNLTDPQVVVRTFVACAIGLFVSQLINSGVDIWVEINRQESRDDIRATLALIEDQTSPEAQERNQATINEVILRVDCNSRAAIEEALIEFDVDAELVGENC